MAWLWLWPAAATLIQPLAWELPDAAGMALKKQNLYTHTHTHTHTHTTQALMLKGESIK